MARYEREGFCPCNEFMNLNLTNFTFGKHAQEVITMLRDFLPLAVYTENGFNKNGDYFSEALLKTDLLGIKIAQSIISLNFITKLNKILITDYINPLQIRGVRILSDDAYISDEGIYMCSENYFVLLKLFDEAGVLSVNIFKC